MRRFDFPVAPVILGVILGPLMEAQFRRTLLVSDGDFGAFLDRRFALALFVLALMALVVPVAVSSVRRGCGLGEEDYAERTPSCAPRCGSSRLHLAGTVDEVGRASPGRLSSVVSAVEVVVVEVVVEVAS
jgi:hypothetical protein